MLIGMRRNNKEGQGMVVRGKEERKGKVREREDVRGKASGKR